MLLNGIGAKVFAVVTLVEKRRGLELRVSVVG